MFASVVTVVAKSNALPNKFAKCPRVIPASVMIVPTNVGVADTAKFAPSVAAAAGAQNTFVALAPLAKTTLGKPAVLAPVVRAPVDLNTQTLPPSPPEAVASRVTV